MGYEVIPLSNSKRIDIAQPFDLEIDCDIDTVIHSAAKAHVVPQSADEEALFYQINTQGTKNLCAALEAANKMPRQFVFISTIAVYGLEEGENIDETFPLKGSSPYAKSKILAEQFLQEWTSKHNIILTILRLPLVAGPKPPGNLGAMIKGIQTGKYLSIGKADAKKSIVWAEDVAKLIPHVASIGGVYNLTDGQHPTFGQIEQEIARLLSSKPPIKVPLWFAKCLAMVGDVLGQKFPINSRKLLKITSTLTFNDQKARREINWNPTPVLQNIKHIL